MIMSKANYIKILILFAVFSSTNSFSQIYIEEPEIFNEDILNDSISKLYSIEYHSLDSSIISITKFYPSGKINSKWSYTSFADTLISKYEVWYENGDDKRIFTLSPLRHKKLKKFLSKDKNRFWIRYIRSFYNGELKTYWENGQMKRHDIFTDGRKKLGVTWNQDGEIVEYYDFQIKPAFPGGDYGFREFVSNNFMYPDLAKEYRVQGCVYVSFDVEKDGKIRNIRITKSVAKILDDVVLNSVKTMPDWIPGQIDGEIVKLLVTMPINFEMR